MAVSEHVWNPNFGLWVPGLPADAPTTDTFVTGETYPDETNVGLPADWAPEDVYTDIATAGQVNGAVRIVGSSNPLSPTYFYRTHFPRHLTVSGFIDFEECMFRGGQGATTNGGIVSAAPSGEHRINIYRCDIEPTTPNYWLDGVFGHHYTVERTRIRGTVDGFGAHNFNTGNRRIDIKILSNWVEWQMRFDVDADHTDGTHNDSVQIQGGEGAEIRGNRFDGITKYSDGTRPADPWGRAAQGVLIQQNVAVGGIYYGGDYIVSNNFFRKHMHPLVFKTRTTGGTPFDVTCENNQWLDSDQRIYSGTFGITDRYNIRTGSQTTINGKNHAIGTYTQDTDNNKYMNVSEVSASLRGTNVYIRRDSTPI